MLGEDVKNNTIFEMRSGSHLYGTNTPISDEDFVGIFMPTREYVLGLKNVELVNLDKKSKDSSGKNTPDAEDRTLYEFRKFVRLAMDNNPSIIEMLFVNDANLVFCNDIGRTLLDRANLFPYKGAIGRFVSYASSQRHKMIVKKDAIESFIDAIEYLEDKPPKMLLAEITDTLTFMKRIGKDNMNFRCGDINMDRSWMVKHALKVLRQRLGGSTHRKDNILKHGYDPKFGSHLIRLLIEGEELLRTGRITFPILHNDKVLSIKQGEWSLKQILEYADELEIKCDEAKLKSPLPNKKQFKKINTYVIETLEEYLFQQ